MRNLVTSLILLFCTAMGFSQTKINITIDEQTKTATLANNVATEALVKKLSAGPISISMNNYGGFEKVGALPWALPTADSRITTSPGDIMLYTGDNIVIFYGSNTWSYTPLGTLDGMGASEISAFVGNGTKQVTISLTDSASLKTISIDKATARKVYTLDGRIVRERPLKPGVYVVDNMKVHIK